MGQLCPQKPSQLQGAPGLPREGELGQGGGREKRHKKKLNILKIYIYRFVFTSSPQIKSSKSTLSKAAGRTGGGRRGEGTPVVPSNPVAPGVPRGAAGQGRSPQESAPHTGPATQELQGPQARANLEGRSPISPAGSLRGRVRALLTQPVADAELTWGQQGGWGEDPDCFLRGTQCLVPQRPVCGRGSTVPLGKLILMANTEPSWQGESEEAGQPHHQQRWEVELEGGEGEGGWGGGQAGPFLWLE